MTEEQWEACTDPQAMLEALKTSRVATERKGRLWAVACHRTFWRSNTEPCVGRMVDVAEALADGAVGDAQRVAAVGGLAPILRGYELTTIELAGIAAAHLGARRGVTSTRVSVYASSAVKSGLLFAGDRMTDDEGRQVQIALLRDIFGNPFRPRPPLDPRVLAWDGGLVVGLASATYEERSLPSGRLDDTRLAVLADALEDAGCTDATLLAHLRGGGMHWRGCFALDAVLGKA